MFGGSFKSDPPKMAKAATCDASRVDPEMLNELEALYPEADARLLKRAATLESLDAALGVICAEIENTSQDIASSTCVREDPLAKQHELERLLPQFNSNEVSAILAGFGGDSSAVFDMFFKKPYLFDDIVNNGWTIEEAQRAEEEKIRNQRELQEAKSLAEMLARRERDEEIARIEKERYVPPPCTAEMLSNNKSQVLALASLDSRGVPSCWSDLHGIEFVEPGPEFYAVAGFFAGTLLYRPEIRSISRVQNYETFERFRANAGNTIMFHGCKSDGNERAIAFEGFQVSKCKSNWHGRGAGSWFAYNAKYSDSSGFVYPDAEGIRHIFMCIVSTVDVRLDDATMRVVGQDCAVPLWIVKYVNSSH